MVCPTDSGRQLALAHQIVRLKANIRKYLRKKDLNTTKKKLSAINKIKERIVYFMEPLLLWYIGSNQTTIRPNIARDHSKGSMSKLK